MSFKVGKIINRYWVVTLLPTFVAITIYADYSHTQEWKKSFNKPE